MDRAQYLLLMALCLLGTLPLEFVFGARVYRRPLRTLRTLAPVVAVFYVWDAVAIARGHWWFSPTYTSGVVLPGGVPVEELAFFVVIPLCALLTFEAVGNLLGRGVVHPSGVADNQAGVVGGDVAAARTGKGSGA